MSASRVDGPAHSIGTPRSLNGYQSGAFSDLDANTREMRLAQLRLAEVQHRINANLASWLPQIQLTGNVGWRRSGLRSPSSASRSSP
jgi:outer membrane protein TolC